MTSYTTHGTCSKRIDFEIDDNGVVTACRFISGCPVNTQGFARLVIGRKADELVAMLCDIACPGGHGSSCPAELAKALSEELAKRATTATASR